LGCAVVPDVRIRTAGRFSRRQGHKAIRTLHVSGGPHVDDATVAVIRGNFVDDDGYACGSGCFHAYRLRFAAQHDIRQQDRVSLVKLVLPELSVQWTAGTALDCA